LITTRVMAERTPALVADVGEEVAPEVAISDDIL
jgi:hypothetical protein